MFAEGPVNSEAIRSAVALALRSPSVCNRQSARVRYLTDRSLLEKVLTVQGGNRGFGHQIPGVLVVTSYLGVFRGARERNQCWIDGGLFAMSLLYALTYGGVGSCPLNWSSDAAQDKALRELLGLPRDEVVIMLIAVGHLPENYRVASSPRMVLEEVLVN
jgi:nitroreductase